MYQFTPGMHPYTALGKAARPVAALSAKAAPSAKQPVVSARFAIGLAKAWAERAFRANIASRRATQTPSPPAPAARPPEVSAADSWSTVVDELNRAQAASNPAFRFTRDGRR